MNALPHKKEKESETEKETIMKILKRTLAAAAAALMAAGALAGCKQGTNEDNPAHQGEVSSFKPDSTADITATPIPTADITAAPIPTADITAAPIPTAEPTPTPEPAGRREAFRNIDLPIEVKYDYFAIPEDVLRLMSEGDMELYRRVALAYFGFENEVEIPAGMEDHPNLWRVIDMYFPLFFADVSDESITENGGFIRWEYTGTAEDHAKTIADFEKKVDELLAPVVQSDSFIMQLLTVYQNFTSGIVYNGIDINGVEQHGPSEVPFVYRHAVDAIMKDTGICWCFARAYNFLICQLGAESLTVHGLRSGDSAIHEWTVFKFKDKWRYADPTWDMGGTRLDFFGFTIQTREHDGYPEKNVSVLEGKTYRASEYFDVSDKFFEPLYTGVCSGDSYELDHENGKIVFCETDYGMFGKQTKRQICMFDPETGKYEYFEQ